MPSTAKGFFVLAATSILTSCTVSQPPCVDILDGCDRSSPVVETFCGLGPHTLQADNMSRASFVIFKGKVSRVELEHCAGGELGGQVTSIAHDTSLCDLEGGCCAESKRWNDEVCKVTLF